MSQSVTGTAKQDVVESAKSVVKCRIPQRMSSARQRPQLNKSKPASEVSTDMGEKKVRLPSRRKSAVAAVAAARSKGRAGQIHKSANLKVGKNKYKIEKDHTIPPCSPRHKPKPDAVNVQQRLPRNVGRPRSIESRPKSANRVKDDLSIGRSAPLAPRSARLAAPERDRNPNNIKRASTIPRKINEKDGKTIRPMIVPVHAPHPQAQRTHTRNDLPDQEAISKQEKISFKSEDVDEFSRNSPTIENDSTLCTTQSDKMIKLKMNWQQNVVQFEKMKSDLEERQKAIVELYAFMRKTHAKMKGLGQKAILPPSEDLRIMNVAKLTAEQLLQLCSSVRPEDRLRVARKDNQVSCKAPLTIDMNKLYAMPSKLVATCEQTLFKRKEIINWFETLKSEDKGIGINKLSKKINEFNAENEMLKCSLEQAKGEFVKELNEIIEFMRKSINETVALQLRTEDLTYTMSELNAQNADLRKQINNAEHLRPHTNKAKIEDLEKELKEERCKKIFMRDRLSRAEGQIKIGVERASQLEAALEQARSQSWNLERKVQQLHEQNTALQTEFDVELNKFRESIRENTNHLELIADAREKLQAEKEDLVKRLEDLSNSYNESLQAMKQEMNANVAKLIETEKKNEDLVEEKNNLEVKLESMCSKLLEAELRCKDLTKELQEANNHMSHAVTFEKELSCTKRNLDIAVIEIEDYRKKVADLNATIKEHEASIKESIDLEENLKSNLISKEKYISDLENQQTLLEKQLQESECKMGSYQEQLSGLKNHIAELQQDFGEFENLNELHEMVNQQRAKLLEATRQNGELAEALQKKDVELARHMDTLKQNEDLLAQRNNVIKMLSGKDEEHTNIIKLLRNNLEMRNQADMDLNQQITEKNAEIEALLANVETRKQQISQLENILLTLEEQLRKVSIQRRKDQEKIDLLEQKITEYESYHMEPRRNELPANNLDSIIKILEDELGTAFDPSMSSKDHGYSSPKRDRRREKLENYECHKVNKNPPMYDNEHEALPTKIVMGNFVKKTYISTNDEQYKTEYKSETLDRKKAITNMETQKWIPSSEPISVYNANTSTIKDSNYPPFRGLLPAGSHLKDNLLSRNIQLLTSNHLRDDKKSKMFKIAGHRL